MLVSLKWLKELVPVALPVPELVDRLDMTGTVVEGVRTVGEALDGIVVGRILSKERHPDADTLWVTTVDVGAEAPLQIVCGAQNFEAGDRVPVAVVGTTLPNGMTIKKAKLRGVVSEGMNCSATELGVGSDASGLLILPADAPVGMSYAHYAQVADTLLELEVTPNRPDCLSMAGVAREVGAILDLPATLPAEQPGEQGPPAAESVAVDIDDPDLCPRYTARLIRGVKVGPSPEWLAERVTAAGARPISNIVDVTNYVMFELGQPLHAFDADTLARDTDGRIRITVRRAAPGERLTTLDGQDRALAEDTLMIADSSGVVALAGVMGGEATEVSDGTVNVLLESAAFNSASINRTSRSLGLISEASLRFERTIDRSACVAAVDRAAALIIAVAGGEVAQGVIDTYPRPAEPRTISLRTERLNEVLGTDIATADAAAILTRLGCEVQVHGQEISATVPSYRPDLEREIDLVEEVLRIWGMERVEATLPAGRGRIGGLSAEQRWRRRIGETLRASGLNETMTYAFGDPGDLERLGWVLAEDELQVDLTNPMSGEQSVLRRTLLPALLRSVSYNQRRGVPDVHLYEMGTVFWTSAGRKQPKERQVVAGVLAGSWGPSQWSEPGVELGFFDGKGIVETLADALGVDRLRVRPADLPWLQPGRAAEVLVGGEVIGWLGEVHPRVLGTFEADAPVTAFELAVPALVRAAREVRPYTDIPRFPAVSLDIAVVVPEDVTAERLEQAVRAAGGKLLEGARLFDVYRGAGVGEGKKSMAVQLTYRAPDRTLTADEVEQAHDRLVRKVLGALGGELRG